MIARIKRAIRRLDRHRWFRAPALALVRGMNFLTFRLLARWRTVEQVFVRGSFVRGPFHPLASDVDLVLVLRASELRPPLRALERFLRDFRLVRWTNWSVRDWWQHLLLDTEMEVVRRHWELCGCDEWRDERGRMPPLPDRPADRERLLLAQWAQQCAWSASALQRFVEPGAPFHDFRTGLAKSATFAARLERLAAWRSPTRRPQELFELRCAAAASVREAAENPPATDPAAELVALFRALERSALHIRALVPAARAAGESAEPRAHEEGAWPDTHAPLRVRSACAGLVVSERALHVVVRSGAADPEITELLHALRRLEPGRPLTFLVPEQALGLWPMACTRERTILGAARDASALARALHADAALQRELLLFESLFLPSSLRLALSFRDREARLERQVWTLARAVLLYERGLFRSTWGEVASALDGDRGPQAKRWREHAAGALPGPRDLHLFELGSWLAQRLYAAIAALPSSAIDSASTPAEAAHG